MRQTLLILCLVLAISPHATYARKQTWWTIENGRFSALTDAKPKRAKKILHELERFRIAAEQIVSISIPADAPKTRLVIFSDLADFNLYSPGNGVLGYMLDLQSGPLIVIPGRTRRVPGMFDPMHIARHEYVHVLSSYHPAVYPCWYEEGFAEVLATAEIDGNDIILGRPERDRAIALYETNLTNQLIDNCSSSWSRGDPYGKFWLLAHYVTFDSDRQASLIQYLNLYNTGTDSLEAFKTAFGVSPRELWESDLGEYRRIPTYRVPIDWSELDDDFKTSEANADVVDETVRLLQAWWGQKD